MIDARERVWESRQTSNGATYVFSQEYNRAGNVVRTKYPGHLAESVYDLAGRPGGERAGTDWTGKKWVKAATYTPGGAIVRIPSHENHHSELEKIIVPK